MTEDDFVKKVMSLLFENTDLRKRNDTDDIESTYRCAKTLYGLGFSVKDCFDYLCCSEEVNPGLEEKTALRKMAIIHSRYRNQKEKII